jgi:hypothetical protein
MLCESVGLAGRWFKVWDWDWNWVVPGMAYCGLRKRMAPAPMLRHQLGAAYRATSPLIAEG